MDISFNNYHECSIVEKILSNYEKGSGGNSISEDVISDIKTSISKYKIGQTFDYIGPMSCTACHRSWTAIVGETAREMLCPKCDSVVTIPPEKFVKRSR